MDVLPKKMHGRNATTKGGLFWENFIPGSVLDFGIMIIAGQGVTRSSNVFMNAEIYCRGLFGVGR